MSQRSEFGGDHRTGQNVALESVSIFLFQSRSMPSTKPHSLGPVLIVSPWFPPTIGGVANVTERIRRLLTSAGVETFVWVCEDEPARPCSARIQRQNVRYVHVPSYLFYNLTAKAVAATLLRAPAIFFRALRFIRKRRIRTVMLMYPIGYAWPFVLLRWLKKVRLIASCHGNEILTFTQSSRSARWLFRAVLRCSDAITVPAPHLRQKAREIIPERQLPIWLIPNCVDVEYFVPRPPNVVKKNCPTLIHVSSFTPRKRTLDIVRAFSLAKLPIESRLLMVGIGPDVELAKSLAAELNVANRIEFVGAPDDIRPFLWQADVLVMASDEESGPLTLLEAMACEVPWIATPWGVAAMLPAGECGLLVPNRAPETMAIAMENLLNDPGQLEMMRKRCRSRVVEYFPETKYAERQLTLLEAVERGEGDRGVDYSVSPIAHPAAPNVQ